MIVFVPIAEGNYPKLGLLYNSDQEIKLSALQDNLLFNTLSRLIRPLSISSLKIFNKGDWRASVSLHVFESPSAHWAAGAYFLMMYTQWKLRSSCC